MQKHNLPNTIDSLNGAIGNEIGSGNIRFIQDVGQKVEGVPYLDKNTNKLHLCVTTTNSTDNDSNFIKFDLKESFNKLQNLIKTTIITANKFYDVDYESKYSYTFPTSKKQILSIMPYDVSFAASETGTCIDNKTIEISVTRFGPSIGQTNQTVKAVIKYID